MTPAIIFSLGFVAGGLFANALWAWALRRFRREVMRQQEEARVRDTQRAQFIAGTIASEVYPSPEHNQRPDPNYRKYH